MGGAPGWARTSGPELRRLVLYPTELRAPWSNLSGTRADDATAARPTTRTRSQKTGDGTRFPDSH